MPLYKGIYYADGVTPMSAEAISAAEATSVGDSIETLPTPVSSSSARDSKFPVPEQGDAVWRLDKMWEERYYEVYNSVSNVQGAIVSGWYPVGGKTPQLLNLGTGTQASSTGWALMNAVWAGNALSYEISGPTGGSITISQPGLYEIKVQQSCAIGTSGMRGLQLTLNSTSVDTAATFARAEMQGYTSHISTIKSFIAADIIRVYAYSSNAGNFSWAQVSVKYLGPSN